MSLLSYPHTNVSTIFLTATATTHLFLGSFAWECLQTDEQRHKHKKAKRQVTIPFHTLCTFCPPPVVSLIMCSLFTAESTLHLSTASRHRIDRLWHIWRTAQLHCACAGAHLAVCTGAQPNKIKEGPLKAELDRIHPSWVGLAVSVLHTSSLFAAK